ncbi:MAG: hypothetical protein GF334_06060, partial [Candidatus Altiarchaeales archaeon]|nr:hypothetical protein [Candidatus Altiarchaeales archaeon]
MLRRFMYTGFTASDDAYYAHAAHRLLEGDFVGDKLFNLRWGMVLAAALSFKLFGVGEGALMIYPMLLSLSSIVLVYLLGKTLADSETGLLACFLCALNPLDVRYASMFFPDLPASFYAGSAAVFFILGCGRGKPYPLALSGLLVWFAWLHKETSLYIAAAFTVYALIVRVNRRCLFVFLGVLVFFLALESLFYFNQMGDFFYRLEVIGKNRGDIEHWGDVEIRGLGFEDQVPPTFFRVLLAGPLKIFLNFRLGFLGLTAAVGVLYAVLNKRGDLYLLGSWFGVCAFLLNFNTTSPSAYQPIPLFDRYFHMLLIPACILSAYALMTLEKQHRLGFGLIFFLLISGYGFGLVEGFFQSDSAKKNRLMISQIPKTERVYADVRSIRVIEFKRGYENTGLIDFSGLDESRIKPESYVYLYPARISFSVDHYDYTPPDFMDDAPRNWILKEICGDKKLFYVPKT